MKTRIFLRTKREREKKIQFSHRIFNNCGKRFFYSYHNIFFFVCVLFYFEVVRLKKIKKNLMGKKNLCSELNYIFQSYFVNITFFIEYWEYLSTFWENQHLFKANIDQKLLTLKSEKRPGKDECSVKLIIFKG